MLGGDNVKDPAFLFFPSDFLLGVSCLTMEERGQYITLLCIQHSKGRLSEKDIKIAIGSVSPDVLAKFTQDENGLYYNQRLEYETEKRERFCAKQYENGCKGGRPKKATKNPNETQTKPNGYPKQNPSGNRNRNKNININSIDKDSLFNTFWSIYPKKIAKEYAYKCFIKIDNLEVIFDDIINALKKQKRMQSWSDKRYIPNPSTWINQKRWEDEIYESTVSSFGDVEELYQEALARSERYYGGK
jgi:uncharacterized protein YdaU (DUF1376 family)